MIHRDITPENILLHDGRAMVMDFGIALAVSAAAGGRMTETGLSLGTPHYMSPEKATAVSGSRYWSAGLRVAIRQSVRDSHTNDLVRQRVATYIRTDPKRHMTDSLSARLQQSVGDGFPLERELAGGGMAHVFLAHDRSLERPVVVKALALEGAALGSAERVRREMRVSAQLQHPHIVPVLAAGGDDGLLWYIMPFVSGESLRERLRREGALPVADAVRLTREVLEALGVAHARGIVHRDIKPENILLEAGHALVADFGVAKARGPGRSDRSARSGGHAR